MMFRQHDAFALSFVVTESVHEGFAALFRDRNPLHMDEAFATSKGFRGRVMHGNILCGFLSYFIGECLPTRDVIIHSQEIEFKRPVYLNDTLAFEAKVDGVFESVGAVEFDFQFRNAEAMVVAKGKIQIGLLP
jgi:3-hydroxybutyryl-CoA dehydratase